ncbi:MAG: helix-turn-helix domain-containing protein [Olsenella sp.]|nr:helix-turn-helix domain-containing protein [Olsenella sp.]MCI1879296.1 helix-turn-helix domain-containing protein [Olsenella sp.]
MTKGASSEVHMVEDIYRLKRGPEPGTSASRDDVYDNGAASCDNAGTRQREGAASATTETCEQEGALLDVSQIAEYLRISRSMVYKLIEGQRISAIRIGRLLRVRKSELDESIRNMGNAI